MTDGYLVGEYNSLLIVIVEGERMDDTGRSVTSGRFLTIALLSNMMHVAVCGFAKYCTRYVHYCDITLLVGIRKHSLLSCLTSTLDRKSVV